ncbi:MAG: hypothetical protein V3T49_07010, partial [Dehalococcoidia bacterium]
AITFDGFNANRWIQRSSRGVRDPESHSTLLRAGKFRMTLVRHLACHCEESSTWQSRLMGSTPIAGYNVRPAACQILNPIRRCSGQASSG